jgi:hypothetical protein
MFDHFRKNNTVIFSYQHDETHSLYIHTGLACLNKGMFGSETQKGYMRLVRGMCQVFRNYQGPLA